MPRASIYYSDSNVTCSTVTCSSSDVIWYNWCDSYTTANTTTSTITYSSSSADATWTYWITEPTSRVVVAERLPIPREDLERERAAIRAEKARRDQAIARATRLLNSNLTEFQRRQFQEHQFFEVLTQNGTVRYLLYRGRSANVYKLDAQGKLIGRFCAHPAQMVPDEDTLLAQKLMLETDPTEFERIANVHPIDERGRQLARLSRLAAAAA